MFYPVSSLRKGGKFHLLWMADSYPTRFASIVSRQLEAQDIRILCDNLRVVISSESGQPTSRYSLRLSSQLMRGLVRVYQRKVNGLLRELCMIHANVTKRANKKYAIQEERENGYERAPAQARRQSRGQSRPHTTPHRRTTRPPEQAEPEEPRVEELLQNNNTTVANIQAITLREAVIPEIVLPNDGFGEEHPEQTLQQLIDRSMEVMLAQPDEHPARSRSVLDVVTEQALDATRGPQHHADVEMMSGLDSTLARPSLGVHTSLADFEKELPDITDIPLLPIPEVTAPQEQEQQPEVEEPEVVAPTETRRADTVREQTQIELEELEEYEPRRKRPRRLIIDKRIEIPSDVFRTRIENPLVELRCDNFSDALMDISVPLEVYMSRPAHAGCAAGSPLAPALTRLFLRHLGYIHRATTDEEVEQAAIQRRSPRLASQHEPVQQLQEPIPEINPIQQQEGQEMIDEQNLPPLEVEMPRDVLNVPEQDISEMLTQKLYTSQEERERSNKRVSDEPAPTETNRHYGEVQIKRTRQAGRQSAPELYKRRASDKENLPTNQQTAPRRSSLTADERRLTMILNEAGLNDIPAEPQPIEIQQEIEQQQAINVQQGIENQQATTVRQSERRRLSQASGSTETPLGSLDRTRVSLGDSDKTTESTRFIRDQWGTTLTMIKIMKCINARRNQEDVGIQTLIALGPMLHEHRNVIIAKCFSSILKLKQAGFIKVIKRPGTLEIKDIIRGPKLDNYTI